MATKKKLLQAAAGTAAAGGGAGALNVEDVFSTYLYEGNGSAQVIDNGINLGQSYGSGGGDFALNGDGNNEAGYLSIASTADFGFGTGDFTVEMFVFPRTQSGFSGFFSTMEITSGDNPPASTTGLILGTYNTGALNYDFNSSSGGEDKGTTLTIGQWSHVALTRSGTSVTLWVNGTSVSTASRGDDLGSSQRGVIGRFYANYPGYGVDGYLSNVRVVKGTALYTSSFTPPTSNLTAVSGTVLLALQGDAPFTDNSSSAHTLTPTSPVLETEFGPFDAAEAGEGGLVWAKSRGTADGHFLFDTERGATKRLRSHATNAENTDSTSLTSFNSNGFSIGSSASLNNSAGTEYASWTFRKAPKFFDVVTYTGTGSSLTIDHNLGVEPAVIIIKRTNTTGNWIVFTDVVDGSMDYLYLNTTDASADGSALLSKSSTSFTLLQSFLYGNSSGSEYVAYLFAHNDGDAEFGPDGDADIIKCGSFTGDGSSDGPEIDLGFEPQWVLLKDATNGSTNWNMHDNMRGITVGGADAILYANQDFAENASIARMDITPTGFKMRTSTTGWNASSANMIYIAIRRGPMAVPTDATDVFDVAERGADSPPPLYRSGFVTDMFINRADVTLSGHNYVLDRLRGQLQVLLTAATDAEAAYGGALYGFDVMDGIGNFTGLDSNNYSWMWKRAPNFFDVVAYTGNGTAGRTVSHNLGVAPEMFWVKRRNSTGAWAVYHKGLNGGTDPEDYYLTISSTNAETTGSYWNNTAPTDSVITFNGGSITNASGDTYIAYLFASVDGVSKVGSYTGNDGTQTIDCGFSSGARFVLIKCTDTNLRSWCVWDSERGIVAGADPVLTLESTQAEGYAENGAGYLDYSSIDWIDPHSSGFTLAGGYGVTNELNKNYIFYAIA